MQVVALDPHAGYRGAVAAALPNAESSSTLPPGGLAELMVTEVRQRAARHSPWAFETSTTNAAGTVPLHPTITDIQCRGGHAPSTSTSPISQHPAAHIRPNVADYSGGCSTCPHRDDLLNSLVR